MTIPYLKNTLLKTIPLGILLSLTFLISHAETASWYDKKSCRKEGTSGIMANGEVLNDNAFTCASWDYNFGTSLQITNTRNGRQVVIRVSDRGPAKKLYKKGRVLDLSRRAFSELAPLEQGVIPIKIEKIK